MPPLGLIHHGSVQGVCVQVYLTISAVHQFKSICLELKWAAAKTYVLQSGSMGFRVSLWGLLQRSSGSAVSERHCHIRACLRHGGPFDSGRLPHPTDGASLHTDKPLVAGSLSGPGPRALPTFPAAAAGQGLGSGVGKLHSSGY